MANKKIRSFLAIELPRNIISKIEMIQNDLKSSEAQVKWVRPGSIHLTLKFFGNIEEKTIDDISRIVGEVASRFNAFHLDVEDVGAFPNESRPRVIWVGTRFVEGTLEILHKELETRLTKLGFEPEKRDFNPHLTLGRVKSLKGKRQLIEQMGKIKGCKLGSFLVESLFLFKSDLRPTGAVYTKLRTFDLIPKQ